jgi:hypothetical protein
MVSMVFMRMVACLVVSNGPRPLWLVSIVLSDFCLTFGQCCVSVTFWYRSGYADMCLWPMDLDPDQAIFGLDPQDANKKLSFSNKFSAYYFLKVYLHHFSKKIIHKEVTKQ